MATQGTVTINIVGDATKLNRALQEAEGGLAGFSAKMRSTGEQLMSVGARMTVGITAPLALLGKKAFDAASDLNESLNKVDVVFGQNAQAIKAWSEDAAHAFGMSRQEALEAAGTFGNLFRSLGIALPTATDMSKKLVQLAADLASFNNASPEDALLALRSGLVGEVEPLRKFGVSLSQARIEQKAMELGLWDGKDAIDANAKAQAAFAIILEDTKLAQGDFARTSDGAANQQRILKAEFEDTAAKLGTTLIPIFLKVAQVVSQVAKVFADLPAGLQEVIVIGGLLLAAVGPLVTVFGALTTAIGAAGQAFVWLTTSTMGPWLIVAAAIAAAVYGLTQAFSSSGGLTDSLNVNAQAFMRLTDAQLAHAAQTILSKLGIEGLTKVVKDLAAASTSTARALVDSADLSAKARAELIAIIEREEAASARAAARSREDAAAKQALAEAADRAAAALARLTAENATIAGNVGFDENGQPVLLTFAGGGVVPGPEGSPHLAMVHGGETVFTPDQLSALGGVSSGAGFTVNANVYTSDPRSAADELIRRLRTEAFLAGMN